MVLLGTTNVLQFYYMFQIYTKNDVLRLQMHPGWTEYRSWYHELFCVGLGRSKYKGKNFGNDCFKFKFVWYISWPRWKL